MSWLFLERAARPRQGRRGLRHLLLVEGARRAGALLGADRPRPAAGRQAPPAAPARTACPAIRTSRRRTSRPTPARSAWASRRRRGWRCANRLAGRPRRIFVLTGDGELQEGQFWESLRLGRARAASARSPRSSTTTRSSPTPGSHEVSDLGDVEAKLRAFGWHVEPRATATTSRRSRATFRALDGVTDRPKVHRSPTPSRATACRFMEGPRAAGRRALPLPLAARPSEPSTRRGSRSCSPRPHARFAELGLGAGRTERAHARSAPRAARRPTTPGRRLLAARSSRRPSGNPTLVALDADLIKDCGLISFAKRFPDRFVECGIAEQDMVSMAGGMARRGALPVVHSFACFLVGAAERADLQPGQRALEGDLRRLARRPAAGRSRPLAPVGARHLRARRGAEAGDGRAVRRGRSGAARSTTLVGRRRERATCASCR